MINPKVKEILISGDTMIVSMKGGGTSGWTGQMNNRDQVIWTFEQLLKYLEQQLQALGEPLFINQDQDRVKKIIQP